MRPTVQVTGGGSINAKLRQIKEQFRKAGVYVGVPKGVGSYEDGLKIAVVGAVQEFGSADGLVPERSFLRIPLRSNHKVFAQIFRQLIPQVIEGKLTMRQLLDQVGAKAASVSQEAISAGIDPGNAESTKQRKGSSTPLIDQGTLRQSITWVQESDL